MALWESVALIAALATGVQLEPEFHTSLVAAGQRFEVGRRVVLWNEPGGLDGYAESCASGPCCDRSFKRYGSRKGVEASDLASLQRIVSQIVLHSDGVTTAGLAFQGLHDEASCRAPASIHFIIDRDGTIYQTLDVMERAYHAAALNQISVGIDLVNVLEARDSPGGLPGEYRHRPVVQAVINGRQIRGYDFRPEQYDAAAALVRALTRVLPGVPQAFPQTADGSPSFRPLAEPATFAGVVGHFHLDPARVDPGVFDWGRLKLGTRFHLPIALAGRSELPSREGPLMRMAKRAYRNAEQRATEFFPVGAGGVWHAGAHLRGMPNAPVYAPARGRIVAVRLSAESGPRASFVLIRHEVAVAGQPRFVFFSLLANLARPKDSSNRIPWMETLAVDVVGAAALRSIDQGELRPVDVAVEAGDVVGWLPDGTVEPPEVHFEIFSNDEVPNGSFLKIFYLSQHEGRSPMMTDGGVAHLVDTNGDGRLEANEIQRFFREREEPDRETLRQLAVRHVHEAAAVGPIGPWPQRLLAQVGMAPDGRVRSFHPITFMVGLAAAANDVPLHWPARTPLPDSASFTPVETPASGPTPAPPPAPDGPALGPLVGRVPARTR